jgi:hypothetical protein
VAEFDSPWKESLDVYFESFLQLCFPLVHQEIDWSRGYLSALTDGDIADVPCCNRCTRECRASVGRPGHIGRAAVNRSV